MSYHGLGQTQQLNLAMVPDVYKLFCYANPTHEACQKFGVTIAPVKKNGVVVPPTTSITASSTGGTTIETFVNACVGEGGQISMTSSGPCCTRPTGEKKKFISGKAVTVQNCDETVELTFETGKSNLPLIAGAVAAVILLSSFI